VTTTVLHVTTAGQWASEQPSARRRAAATATDNRQAIDPAHGVVTPGLALKSAALPRTASASAPRSAPAPAPAPAPPWPQVNGVARR
jgi:hypothetical protein